MDTLTKLLITEWGGAPLLIWLLGALVILGLVVSRVPFRLRRKTKKGEFLLETKPAQRNKQRTGR